MEKNEILKLPIYKSLGDRFLVKKDIVTDFPHNFNIKEGGNYEYATTSGTTSDRMEIIRKPNWWQDEYIRTYNNDLKLKRYLDEKLHKVIFTTAQCSNLVCFREKPPLEKRIIGTTLYVNNNFNPWEWCKKDIEEIIKEINYFKPYYLDADPIYLSIFLYLKDKFGIKTKIHLPSIITLSYEFVTNNSKNFISNKLKTDIRNLYGTTEFGYVFLENEEGKMKICKDLVDIKLLPINDNIYSLIVDSYKNEYMPLINYRVGDLVYATKEEFENFEKDGIVSKMAGREKDLIDNKISFSMLDDIVSKFSNKILLYQFYYIDDKVCNFKYITYDNTKIFKEEENRLIDEFKKIGLDNDFTFSLVDEITPEISGKFSIIKRSL